MSAPVTLVTGAAGFVGSWLLRHAHRLGWRLVGVRKPQHPATADSDVEWRDVDLRDRAATDALLRDTRPRYIVHLAAVSFAAEAARDPLETLRVNYAALDHLLGGMARHAPEARLLYIGTSEVYGPRPQDSPPLHEQDSLAPLTPYASSKAAAEARAALAATREGLDVVRVRPFNHSGRGRPPHYAESSFARQIALIERGEQEPVIRVGNLAHIRDFSDVRDIVRAYTLLLEHGEPGSVYNVCSGQGRSIRSLLDYLISRSESSPAIEVDPALYRDGPPERRTLVGDPARMRALGWQPRHPFEETLDELLAQWRAGP